MIDQWATGTPQDTLARLGARTRTVFHLRIAPSTVSQAAESCTVLLTAHRCPPFQAPTG